MTLFFFLEPIAQAVQTDDNFFQTDNPNRLNAWQFFWNGYPEPFKRIPNLFKNSKTFFKYRVPVIRGTQRQFSKNICSEDDLRSRIFQNICCKISCLPTSPGIFKHLKKWYSRLSLNGHLYKTDTPLKQTPRVGPCLSLLPLFDSLLRTSL